MVTQGKAFDEKRIAWPVTKVTSYFGFSGNREAARSTIGRVRNLPLVTKVSY